MPALWEPSLQLWLEGSSFRFSRGNHFVQSLGTLWFLHLHHTPEFFKASGLRETEDKCQPCCPLAKQTALTPGSPHQSKHLSGPLLVPGSSQLFPHHPYPALQLSFRFQQTLPFGPRAPLGSWSLLLAPSLLFPPFPPSLTLYPALSMADSLCGRAKFAAFPALGSS